MTRFFASAQAMLLAFWWGGLTMMGAVVVPLLFSRLPSPAMAGNLAAQLFSAQTYIALICGLGWFLLTFRRKTAAPSNEYFAQIWVIAAMFFAAVNTWAVAPRILIRENLALWHTMGSVLYFLQWLAAGLALYLSFRRSTS